MSRVHQLCLLAALVSLPVFAATAETSEKPVNKKTSQAPVTQRIPKSRKQLASPFDAPETPVDKGHGPIVVGPPVELHISKANGKKFDLRSLPFVPPVKRERPELEEPVANPVPFQSTLTTTPPSGAAPTPPFRAAPAPAPLASFDGLDFANWGAGHPPDTNGDVGPNYYIQTINTSIGVFRKSDGARVAAFTFNTFMSQGNFGNLCDTDNFGDPVVLYDSFEDRWVITDFAFKLDGSNNVINPPGSFQCVAVSMNGDPVNGGWNYYSINTSGGLGDYPKFGIWPDGLYMSANMFNYPAGGSFENTRLYAFNKYQMYAGSPTVQVVSFDLPSDQFTVLPANARLQTGTPPSGSPNYFASVWNFLNEVEIWKFHVDWNNVTLSSVTGPFDSQMGFWWEQFSRSSTTTAPTPANFLDSLYPRLMVQNQYSNIGGAESLWTSHTVGAGNPTSNLTSAQSAVRYYQVNVTGGTVAANTVQSFTFSPDATLYRYMPSVAVNRGGDMAIGYTTSNATTNPAIVYAGRLAGDPVNSITQTEQLLFQGTGSQSGTCGSTCTRWGDYSAMTLDPNGCTFWYTNEYYVNNGLAFNTRIGSFSFPSCTPVGAGGTVNGTVTATAGGAPIIGATVSLGARTTTTDANGNYAFNNIPAGTYPSMTAAFPGDVTATSGAISVTDGGTSTRNFSLSSASSGSCYVDTTQSDFQGGVPTNVEVTSSPGDVKLTSPNFIDQQSNTAIAGGFGLTSTGWNGQTFKAGVSGKLVAVDVNLFCLSCTGTTPNFTASIRATSGGLPTGADLVATTIAGFNDGGAGSWHTADFSAAPLTITAGTTYAFVIRPVANPSAGGYDFSVSFTPNPYAFGSRVSSTNSGSTWAATATRSADFHTYVNNGYSTTGNLISSIKDGNPSVGNQPTWSTLSWTGTTPANTSLKFQVAGSNNVNGPYSFVGPDGTAATFFTTSGASIAQFNGLRYLQYKALLGTTDTTVTPTLNDATVCFADTPCPWNGAPISPSNNPVCPNSTGMTASVPGGSSNYSWSVTNGTITGGGTSSLMTFTSGPIGSVGLQVIYTDPPGCVKVSTLSIPIDFPAKPTITPGGPTTFCAGGSVTLTSSSATGNQWYLNGVPIGAATNQTLDVTASGNYTVNYVDGSNCTSPVSDTTTVVVNPNPLATITVSNVQTVNVSGSGTFTLRFNGSATPALATGATPAAVQAALNALPTIGGVGGSVVVTQSGLVYTVTFGGTLTGPQPQLTSSASAGVTAAVVAAPVCANSTANQASGQAGLSYTWGITNGTITSATNVQTITYTAGASGDVILTLTVTDGNGCSSSSAPADVPINQPPPTPAISGTTNGTGSNVQACPEEPLTLTATGSTGAVSYQWYKDLDLLSGETNSTYQATGAATYYVTATDANGCTTPQSAGYVVQDPTPHSPFIVATGTMMCSGGSVQLTSNSGSTGHIQWYEDGGPISGATDVTYVATSAGTYTAVIDSGGCHSSVSNSIVLAPSASSAPDATITAPATVLMSSAANAASVPDAGAGATYSWAGSGVLITSGSGTRSITFRINSVGTRALGTTVTSADGCTSFGSVNVNVVNSMTPTHFSVSAPSTVTTGTPFSVVVTALDSTNSPVTNYAGTVHFTSTSAGTLPADYTFSAATDNGSQSFNVTLTTTGAQTLTVGDGTITGNAGITVDCPVLAVTASNDGPGCGSVTITANTANTGVTFAWTGPSGFTSSQQSVGVTTAGTYTVTLSYNGCTSESSSTTVAFSDPIPPTPTITASTNGTGTTDQACPEQPLTLTANGATGATSYQWYQDNGTINSATSSTYQATGSGTYYVTATDSCGTSAKSAGYVVQNPTPHSAFLTATGTMICVGGSVEISSDSATGIQWYKDGNPIPGATAQQYTATAAGTYTAILDALGCHSAVSNSIVLTASSSAAPNATITAPATVLVNSLNNAASVPDAGAGATYSWSAVAGNITSGSGTPNVTFRLFAPGAHALNVTITLPGGCTTFGSVNVNAVSSMTATHFNVSAPATVTDGTSFGLTVTALDATNSPVTDYSGTVHFTSSATGTLPSDYTFAGATDNGSHSFNATLTTSGAQTLTVGDGTSSGSTGINVFCPELSVTASNDGPACGSVTIAATTANSGVTYAWTGPGGFTSSLPSVSVTTSGTYTVTISQNDCVSPSSSTSVTVNPIPATPTINAGGPTSFCTGGSVTLTSSSASGNQWSLNGSPIGGATSQTYLATASGDYTVVVTSLGCSSAASAATTVTVNPNPNAAITAPSAVQSGSTGNNASVASAGAGATYNWSITNGTITAGTGANSITFTAGAIGTLTLQVTVTTSASCSDTKSANVNVGVPAVTVTSVSPATGSINGHTAVTVNGTGFANGATVTFGGTAATSVVVVSATKITGVTPAHVAGQVNVTVTNTDTSTGTLTNGYTYAELFDPNGDHTIDSADIFYLINYLFMHGPAPVGGTAAGDANGDGVVDPSDIFYLVNYLFLSGPKPYAEPVAHIASVSAPVSSSMKGSISLGQPVLRGDRYVIPVSVEGSPSAMSLRLRFDAAGEGVTIHRASGLQPAFEIVRHGDRELTYLVDYDGTMNGVVASIEVPASARLSSIEIDGDGTLICDRDGIRKATVAAGTLTVNGTSIDAGRSPIKTPRSER
ncbi:MAG TPA: IPT/TIG domain-containing protein [Thermoanaerobaculia bacterium]|jgi:hypothetical protein|nr:IPT/TIG domain-containing protein [Thermoanaerobaculia bacterium]